jgi:hypothetical protein
VNVADHFIRVDFATRSAVKISNRGRRHCQTFKFLLRDCVSYGPHVFLKVLLAKSGHRS